MRTRIEVLPDGRIFCGFVITKEGCRSVYTHIQYLNDNTNTIKVRHYKVKSNSLTNGMRNTSCYYVLGGDSLPDGWYVPAAAEGVVVSNLFPQCLIRDFRGNTYWRLRHSVTQSHSAILLESLPDLSRVGWISTSSCVSIECNDDSGDFHASYIEISTDSTFVTAYSIEWLYDKKLLVSTEKVEL